MCVIVAVMTCLLSTYSLLSPLPGPETRMGNCDYRGHFTEAEMKPLGIKTESVSVDFEEGDTIAVVAGVWKDTVGVVQKMDRNKQTATINVELFGRETPVEISFAEVRKV